MPLTANDLAIRTKSGHCTNDILNETCERFFQIWSHKAANISNDLIEYTIRRMQSDRLRFLFQTRNELTQRETISPICQIPIYVEDELRRIKEHIRRFCLTTRNVYRHLRSDSRIYPNMSIRLDQNIMIKICRFIFKTKVLIQILSKEKHLKTQQDQQLQSNEIKQFNLNEPYRNITKAFIVLQSNFEILFGDILEKDFFQNAQTAVQSLPIILDTSKTIRLIYCALYKLTEPERQAEIEARRQRRQFVCNRGYGSKKQGMKSTNKKLKTINDMLIKHQPTVTNNSTVTPTKTLSNQKSTIRRQSSKSQLNSPNTIHSKTSKKRPSSSSSSIVKEKTNSVKKISTKMQKKKSPNKNTNALKTDSLSSHEHNKTLISSKNTDEIKHDWTTWLHNTTLNFPSNFLLNQINNTILPKRALTTWASLDRTSKI
ncbi:hypothetical protein I4U23_030575 [Adineta vaga]|nr:hypothetical protein I4U23_030575 [Adineta vaga]